MSSQDRPPPFLPGFDTLDAFSQASLRRIAMATKESNGLPSDQKDKWEYYTTFRGFRQVMSAEHSKISELISKCLKYNGIKLRIGGGVGDVVEQLIEANDQLLERINTQLDEAAGLKKDVDPMLVEVSAAGNVSGSWNKAKSAGSAEQVKLLAAKNVARPQMKFKDRIDNSMKPFIPKLKEKPNSLKPLSILVEYGEDGTEFYSHPYLYEIDHLKIPESQKQIVRDIPCPKIEEVPFEFVDSLPKFDAMLADLSSQTEIAVDLEHHSYRTYLGLTCLVQISTHKKDYLVDPFPLWDAMTDLNKVMTNPKIVKILHGGDSDVEWLQRDFSVYIVNMFDTYRAAKVLGFPRGCLSLKFLLSHYCNVNADKKYQLADWRMRPLPEEMIKYAREDTRFLLHIYHRMKTELITKGNENKNLLNAAVEQSNSLCRKRYEKVVPKDTDMLRKWKAVFNSRQISAFKEIFKWRNKTAREEDESEAYVLPVHMMLKICTELPREMQGILACCNPVPPFIRQNLVALHQIILNAREKPLTVVDEDIEKSTISSEQVVRNADIMEDPLRCPHDLSHPGEGKLDTLLDSAKMAEMAGSLVKAEPVIKVFSEMQELEERSDQSFLTPYRRYQMLKPYLKSLKDEEAKRPADPDNSKTVEDRIQSIKDHFEALTAMTPAEYKGDEESKEASSEEVEKEEEEEEEDLSQYQDAGPVQKNIRVGLEKESKASKKSKKKKLKEADNVEEQPAKKEIEIVRKRFVV